MGNVIAFVPGSGGVGATTLAAAVAVRAAAAGRGSVVIDLDRIAGRLDVVLGVEQLAGWRWPDLDAVSGVVDGLSLLAELPSVGGAAVLSQGDRVGGGVLRGDGRGAGEVGGAEVGGAVSRGARVGGTGADVDEWLERVCDVVSGLREAVDVVVLDCARDERVLAALADQIDVIVVVVGTGVTQVAAAAATVPVVRAVLDGVRLGATGRHTLSALSALSALPALSAPSALSAPVEPWVVLRGHRVEDDLHDLLMDHLDVPVVGTVGDDRRMLADLAAGLAPGESGRGPVVEMADRLLLRLVSLLEAA